MNMHTHALQVNQAVQLDELMRLGSVVALWCTEQLSIHGLMSRGVGTYKYWKIIVREKCARCDAACNLLFADTCAVWINALWQIAALR